MGLGLGELGLGFRVWGLGSVQDFMGLNYSVVCFVPDPQPYHINLFVLGGGSHPEPQNLNPKP